MLKELNSYIMRENKKGTPLLRALLFEHRLPWRHKTWLTYKIPWLRDDVKFLEYISIRPLNKLKLRLFENLPKYTQEDITVVIPIKNRYSKRLLNLLKSIRNQSYNQDLIKIILVDYDSKKEQVYFLKKSCHKYNAKYIRVDNHSTWSRSHCLNIGIKRTKTKYLLSTDVDIIFEKDYIKKAIQKLKKQPFSIIVSQCWDLPENWNNQLDFNKLKSLAKPRYYGQNYGSGINMTSTYFYHKLRGYDEKYKIYGIEDLDLIKRLIILGLNIKIIDAYYFHQWHPVSSKGEKFKHYISKNLLYYKHTNSIVRNKTKWGELN